jgi:hypothetical protein
MSSKGGSTSSYATAGVAFRVTGVLITTHHDKVEPPTRRMETYHRKKWIFIITDKKLSNSSETVAAYKSHVLLRYWLRSTLNFYLKRFAM